MNYKKYEIPDNFKSDGCTLFPDRDDYKQCCYKHDHAIKHKTMPRIKADLMFARCMWDNFSILQKHRPKLLRQAFAPLDKLVVLAVTAFVTLQGLSGLPPVTFAMLLTLGTLVGGVMIWG